MSSDNRIDPEPFTIIAAVVGVVSGVATVADFVSKRLHNDEKDARQIRIQLDQAADILKLLATDLFIVSEVLHEEEISDQRPLDLGIETFLRESQFDRYSDAVDRIFERLHKLMQIVCKLEKLFSRHHDSRAEASQVLIQIRDSLRRTLRDGKQTIAEAIKNITAAIDQIGRVVAETRKSFN